jgi:hypothetical protein
MNEGNKARVDNMRHALNVLTEQSTVVLPGPGSIVHGNSKLGRHKSIWSWSIPAGIT